MVWYHHGAHLAAQMRKHSIDVINDITLEIAAAGIWREYATREAYSQAAITPKLMKCRQINTLVSAADLAQRAKGERRVYGIAAKLNQLAKARRQHLKMGMRRASTNARRGEGTRQASTGRVAGQIIRRQSLALIAYREIATRQRPLS